MIDVFISYSRATRSKVEPIKKKLDAIGLDCFFDMHQIDGGANFPDVIDKTLRDSKSVLCCWSPQYFLGQWSMIECRDAMARGIIVPIAIERFEQFAPPADLRQINWFDLVEWDGDDGHEDWNRTLLNLGKLIGRDLTGAPISPAQNAVGVTGEAQLRAALLHDLRSTWAIFPAKADIGAVEQFLGRVRTAVSDSGFEFELEYHLDGLRREAKRRAENAARSEMERQKRIAAAQEARRKLLAVRCQSGTVWRDTIPGMPENTVPEMVTLPRRDPHHSAPILALSKHLVAFADIDAAIAVGADLHWPVDSGLGRNQRAAVNISWHDAQAYVTWLNGRLGLSDRRDAYRLPTEAEWEIARQETSGVHGSVIEIGNFPGALWEWCEDPNGSAGTQILRRLCNEPTEADGQAGLRTPSDCSTRRADAGFRLARSFEPPQD